MPHSRTREKDFDRFPQPWRIDIKILEKESNAMKKRYLIVVLAVLCLVSSCFVGSTFAKYTSTVEGTNTATIATWVIKQDSNNLFEDGAKITFDLDETVTEVNDANADAEVKANTMAPGTQGSFAINLKNESDVTADYSIDVDLPDTMPAAMKFTYKIGDGAETDLNDGGDIAGQLAHSGGATVITITWVWTFTDTVENDFAGTDFTVSMTGTFTQVD